MTKEYVWAIDEDGKPCKCYAKPENRGKGRCPHKFHAEENETVQQLISRSKEKPRRVLYQGISGTVEWSVDDDGTLLLEPVDGYKGTLADTKKVRDSYCKDWVNYRVLIKKVKGAGKVCLPKNSSLVFGGLSELTSVDLSNFDTSKVQNMSRMFASCYKLTTLDLSNFDTRKVTDMNGLFDDCWKLANLNLSNFDTSKVIDMSHMFANCRSLTSLNISHFDTSNVTNMSGMFHDCHSLADPDLSNFDTSNVEYMHHMFMNCYSLKEVDLSNFGTRNVVSMGNMFECCKNLTELDLSNFDMNKVEDMGKTFYGCTSLKKLNLFSLTNPQNVYLKKVFDGCKSLSHLTLPKDVEKRSNDLIVLSTFLNHINIKEKNFSPEAKKTIRPLLNLVEKSTGVDLSKEKQKLENIPDYGIDYIALSKSNNQPVKKIAGIMKILQVHQVTMGDIQTDDFKALKEKGVLSDIDSFTKGVPLEDILA